MNKLKLFIIGVVSGGALWFLFSDFGGGRIAAVRYVTYWLGYQLAHISDYLPLFSSYVFSFVIGLIIAFYLRHRKGSFPWTFFVGIVVGNILIFLYWLWAITSGFYQVNIFS